MTPFAKRDSLVAVLPACQGRGHASRVPEAGEDLELKMGENWRRTGTVLAAVQLDDGRLLVQAVMNNDMEADSVFRVRDDANTLSIEPLPYSLEE